MRKSRYTYMADDMAGSRLEEGIFVDEAKKKIAVVGIGGGCGATFVAVNLAYIMGKLEDGVCYVEMSGSKGEGEQKNAGCLGSDGGAYRSIPLDRVIAGKRAVNYFGTAAEDLFFGNRRNLYANVNWAVRLPATEDQHGRAVAEPASPRRGRTGSGSFGSWESAAAQAHRDSQNRDVGIFVAENPTDYTHSDAFINSAASECRRHFVPPQAAVPGCALHRRSDNPALERIPSRHLILDEPPLARLTEAELVVCVLDPLPSRLHSGMEKLSCLRENRIKAGRKFSPVLNLPTPVIWVLNKDNSRVSHRELEDFLKIRFDFVIPLIDERIFYHAEYSGVPIFKLLDSACQGRTGGTPVRDPAASAGSLLGKLGAACGSAALRGLRGQPSVPPQAAQAARAELERLAKHILNELHYTI